MIIFGKLMLNENYGRRTQMGNSRVDKSQQFVDEGMTLITETDSDKYLNMAAKRNRNKKKEELYPMPQE